MKIINKIIYMITVVLISCMLFTCGSSEPEEPPSLIFPGLERITLDNYSDPTFSYHLPDEVAHAVLGIFDDAIDTSNGIVNMSKLVAGNHTGRGMSRTSISKDDLWIYTYGDTDFSYANTLNVTSPLYHWAVWGYDKYGNLTHASADQGPITITY